MTTIALKAKACMSHLLLGETFDDFAFIEGEITTFNKFTIDGFMHKDFFEEPPEHAHSRWKDIRDFCFSVIRGKRTPLSFKIVLSLAPERFAAFLTEHEVVGLKPEDIQGMYLNLSYDGTALQCITGVSMRIFTMDKTLEREWDAFAEKLLLKLDLMI